MAKRRGFFAPGSNPAPKKSSLIPGCAACKLYKACESPKMKPTGDGQSKILVLAEAPGEQEDERGVQLIGKSGQELRKALLRVGVDLDEDCVKTNALICRPTTADGRNRKPSNDEIDWCRPNLNATLAKVKPEIILVLGGMAVRSLIGPIWRDDTGPMERWAGWRIPDQKHNAWICPTWHPSFILRREDDPVLRLWWERHLEGMADLVGQGRPHPDGPPNYAADVGIIWDDEEAADFIETATHAKAVAFDYETDRLKPDHKDARVVCASIAWGDGPDPAGCIAYPWTGKAIEATGRLLRHKVPKFVSNLQFEDRWTRREFGHRVRGWYWDTMHGAHVLDNRRGISSVKFQAYARLGQGDWDTMDQYKKAKYSNEPNQIGQVNLERLLQYCGMDSLVEYRVAVKQAAELNYPLPWEK